MFSSQSGLVIVVLSSESLFSLFAVHLVFSVNSDDKSLNIFQNSFALSSFTHLILTNKELSLYCLVNRYKCVNKLAIIFKSESLNILTSVESEPCSPFCPLAESPCRQTRLNLLRFSFTDTGMLFLGTVQWLGYKKKTVLPGYAYFSNLLRCQGKNKIFFLVIPLCSAPSWKHIWWQTKTYFNLSTSLNFVNF